MDVAPIPVEPSNEDNGTRGQRLKEAIARLVIRDGAEVAEWVRVRNCLSARVRVSKGMQFDSGCLRGLLRRLHGNISLSLVWRKGSVHVHEVGHFTGLGAATTPGLRASTVASLRERWPAVKSAPKTNRIIEPKVLAAVPKSRCDAFGLQGIEINANCTGEMQQRLEDRWGSPGSDGLRRMQR
jgi:hypothetical protein